VFRSFEYVLVRCVWVFAGCVCVQENKARVKEFIILKINLRCSKIDVLELRYGLRVNPSSVARLFLNSVK